MVVSNYNGKRWPAETESDFAAYVTGGGGFVAVHAANNAFPDWPEFNRMIGLGGWEGRNEKWGPYLYFNEAAPWFAIHRPARAATTVRSTSLRSVSATRSIRS